MEWRVTVGFRLFTEEGGGSNGDVKSLVGILNWRDERVRDSVTLSFWSWYIL